MDKSRFAGVFPLGSHLCREPMPAMSELKRDMENLARHGFNLIKLQENWLADEPEEGHFDFSKYEELIEYAGKLDLGVYLGFTMEHAPNWLFEKYPDCRMVGMNGLPIAYQAQYTLPSDGKPGPCFDHPEADEAQKIFLKKAVGALAKYENIVVWNTWQEIGYWAEAADLTGQYVCFCEHTLNRFRDWLIQKYGDLDGLNTAWNSHHTDWKHVQPNRLLHNKMCLPTDIDWKYFIDIVKRSKDLSVRAAAIKEADPLGRPVFAHKGSAQIGSGQDWAYARCQDFLGSSAYPSSGAGLSWDDVMQHREDDSYKYDMLTGELWDTIVLRFDYIRSCNRRGAPVWAAEFQGGPISNGFRLGRTPSPDDIRRWMLGAVSAGVGAVSFWVTRAEIMAGEGNGYGLLDSEGDRTERLEEASRVGRELNRHADIFTEPARQDAEIAIIIDEYNHQLCDCLADVSNHLAYTVRGWHRMLWESSIPVDFVEASQLGDSSISRYKALILPMPLSLSEEMSADLAAYVKSGGNLISEACPGRFTRNGTMVRGELPQSVRDLFGVDHRSLLMVHEPGRQHRWNPRAGTWGVYADDTMLRGAGDLVGSMMRANIYIETFECTRSSPILMYGDQTAGTANRFGSGCAWLLGSIIGHTGTAYRDEDSKRSILQLLKICGVGRLHVGRLIMRKRGSGGNREAWMFTNPYPEALTECVDVFGWKTIEDLFGAKLPVRDGKIDLTVGEGDIRAIILSK